MQKLLTFRWTLAEARCIRDCLAHVYDRNIYATEYRKSDLVAIDLVAHKRCADQIRPIMEAMDVLMEKAE